ncbi:ATP-dependent zinc metalloprotease FtsH 3 [Diplonema papillatum]|nr:ATP-dependent zinc metalloprotease FtsH 3 [Diplonema papillatum]
MSEPNYNTHYAYQPPPPQYNAPSYYPQQPMQPHGQQRNDQQQPGGDYQSGYQSAVRDMSGGRGVGSQLALSLLNATLFLGVPLYFLYRINRGNAGGGSKMMNQMMEQMNPIPKRNFRVTSKETKFKDVIGIDEAKEEVQEYVDFLKQPRQYTELGARLPRGALLTGKPGTGKTLLARAVAGEADVAFFSAGGADFIEIFGGSGPKRVRELFAEARANAPAVIFIDELDAVGSKRSTAGDQGIGGEENRTTNALLEAMDGMTTKDNVVVFAATNHPEALDSALVRAGRFDRKIDIPVPDEKARTELFDFYGKKIVTAANYDEKAKALEAERTQRKQDAEKKKSAPDRKIKEEELKKNEARLKELVASDPKKPNQDAMEDILQKQIRELKAQLDPEEDQSMACSEPPTDTERELMANASAYLAARTPGITPATIATVCNEAAIVAARKKKSFVNLEDVQDALDNVLIGKKHRQRMTPEALKRVAYHEAGHTVAQWFLSTQSSVIKVSIIPRGRAGGYTQFRQPEELDPKTQRFLTEQIVVMLGGRCSEKIFFNDFTTGAHDDLQKAFQASQNQVSVFGMSSLGHFSLDPQSEARGRAFSHVSEDLKNRIEREVRLFSPLQSLCGFALQCSFSVSNIALLVLQNV